MKKLKLDHAAASRILSGEKRTTWRLFDDKDLSVNDHLLLIDKVDPMKPESWQAIGVATVDHVMERRLSDITQEDLDGSEPFMTPAEMLAAYRTYYGSNVTWQTPVKIIHFQFSPELPDEQDQLPTADNKKLTLYADGGSRGNPGPSACGFVIYDEQHKLLVKQGNYLGITTNNQAEYTALKQALEAARQLGAREIHVYMDSMLVINQMRGIFKVKNRDLWPLHDAAQQLCSGFDKVSFTQVPRESNRLADAAVNAALDQHIRETQQSRVDAQFPKL